MSAPSNLQATINEYLELRMELTMRCQLTLLRAQLAVGGEVTASSDTAHQTPVHQVPPPALGGDKAAAGGGKPKPPARQQPPRAALPQQAPPQALLGGPIEDPTAGGQT